MTHSNLEQLREIRLHSILGVKEDGRRHPMRCPFHADKTPSFVLYPDGSYHCFGCAKHGHHALDFFVEMCSGDFKKAVKELENYL